MKLQNTNTLRWDNWGRGRGGIKITFCPMADSNTCHVRRWSNDPLNYSITHTICCSLTSMQQRLNYQRYKLRKKRYTFWMMFLQDFHMFYHSSQTTTTHLVFLDLPFLLCLLSVRGTQTVLFPSDQGCQVVLWDQARHWCQARQDDQENLDLGLEARYKSNV